ncbi:hypothetical protein [Neorhizobium sp. T25_13]|nr:hypothetical protein [Neorhizobium sp. T25_13]
MREFARETAEFWRNDVVEKARRVERYNADPWIARDIRILAAIATEDGR